MAFGGFGHGGGLLITSVASVWGLWPRRGVIVGSVGSYGSVWMRRGCLELRARLSVSRWPVGSSRRPRRHGDGSEARGSLRATVGWSQRARELPVASTNRTGELRRRQALPAVLASVVGALASGLVLGPVVRCSVRWSSARTGGLVLGPVVGCLVPCHERGMRAMLRRPWNLESSTASKGSRVVTTCA
jgi:hypothetical protein